MHTSTQTPVWFITGCSTGLGRSLAQAVLRHGYRLIATARHIDAIEDLVASHPESVRAFALDVTDAGEVAGVVARAAAAFGRLDVVVNNAGYGLVGSLEDVSEDQIIRNFQANFFGALHVIRSALPILRGQRSGHFVTISAAAVIGNYPGFSIYGASKWALEGACESLAAEVKPLGIRVTVVQPGPFRTQFISRSLERVPTVTADYDATSGKFLRFLESMDGKQPGDPDKAAEAIVAAVDSANPPMRLVLGKYAVEKARRKLVAAARELENWSAVGLATDA